MTIKRKLANFVKLDSIIVVFVPFAYQEIQTVSHMAVKVVYHAEKALKR